MDYIEINNPYEITENKDKIYSDYIYILIGDYGLQKILQRF